MPKCPFCDKPVSSGTTTCPYYRASITATQPPPKEDLEQRLRVLMDQGEKIAAIKLYREQTGVGLAAAKVAVESLQAGRGLHVSKKQLPEGVEGEVLRLLGAGKKIPAIKHYRERTGVGLKEAKDAVEAVGEQHGLAIRGSGCLGTVMFVLFVIAFLLNYSLTSANELLITTDAKKDEHGFFVHNVESEFQSSKTLIRVLLPEPTEEGRRYPIIYVLPVEVGTENRFGGGLLEVKKLGLQDKHGVIFVAPTFSQLPWYADHPTDTHIRQESYFIKVVVPFVEKTYPAKANSEGRLLLGFSKSGWGAWSLLLRHPDVFGRAAAWDAPMMMDRMGKYGNAPIFGDQGNFEAYRISSLLREKGKALGDHKRLILNGYGNFRPEHEGVHALLDELKIPHEYHDGPKRKHDWHSGWVEEAVGMLVDAGKIER